MGYLTVSMEGRFDNVEVRTSANGNKFVKGKFVVPMKAFNGSEYEKFVNIIGWEDVADVVEKLPDNMTVKVEGSLRTTSYDTKCPKCGEPTKGYWTEIVIDNIDL